jgi:hypothetical protein
MKNVILAAALVAASAVTASAQEAAPVALSSAIQSQILNWVPDADLSNLTNAQYARLVTLFTSSDNLRSGEDPANQVRVILNAQ